MAEFGETKSSAFSRARPLFDTKKQHVPARAVLSHHFPGRVFLDDRDLPRAAVVWALGRWAYIGGDPTSPAAGSDLARLVEEVMFPGTRQMRMTWFELYAPDHGEWIEAIQSQLAGFSPERHDETTYRLDPDAYRRRWGTPVAPPDMRIEAATFKIVAEHARESPQIASEFKSRFSFGFRLLRGDEVVAVCRSNGFRSGREFMIDVETSREGDRGKGYATLVSTALIRFALERDQVPLWETTEDNVASQRLATKLGFVPCETYPVFAMRVPDRTA